MMTNKLTYISPETQSFVLQGKKGIMSGIDGGVGDSFSHISQSPARVPSRKLYL